MEYLSLYDYLGKPAGEKLGLEVAAAARAQGIEIQTKEISGDLGNLNTNMLSTMKFVYRRCVLLV